MERYIEKFIRYLQIERNYSGYTILNYKLDLSDFQKFLGASAVENTDYLVLRKYLAFLKEKNL
ncbi:MAG: site-specific integrase, partial [Candidatus Omnitrophota bacterium]